jgi:prepilin-type processing-associated H-X9-DG protein
MNNPTPSTPQAGFVFDQSQSYSIQNFPEAIRNFDAPFMACPSDSYANRVVSNGNVAGYLPESFSSNSRSGSYVQSLGDVVTLFSGMIVSDGERFMPNGRGPFGKYFEYTLHSITDGTSNTAIFTERCTGAGGNSHSTYGGNIRQFVVLNADSMLTNYSDGMYTFSPLNCMANYTSGNFIKSNQDSSGFAGTAWYDGWSPYSWATFITPPNSASCFRADKLVEGNYPYGPGIFPPTSYHAGGVNVAKADGSIVFVNDTIHCGDKLAGGTFYNEGMSKIVTGISEFGIWGALGSRDGGETINLP